MTQGSTCSRTLRGFALAVAAMVGAISLALVHPPLVAAEPEATNVVVETADPSAVRFRVRITSDVGIASATLNYKILNPDGNVGGTLRAEVSGRAADASVELQTNSNERYIPIGTELTYAWSIVDQNGAIVTTPEESMTFMDGRYQWASKAEGQVAVFWYGENEANADRALKAVANSITENEALLRVKLDYPIRVVVWRNSADAKAAQRPRAATFDQQVITGGSRVSPDLLHIYDPLGGFVDVARHEAAHIVTKVAGDGKIATIPSWIDEGTAVYAQDDPGSYAPAVRRAIASDSLTRLRSMSSPTNQPGQVDIFYGQSWSVVKFTIDTYGAERFAAVFKAVKDGSPIDDALQAVIGVDQDGLYNAWRQSVGLKPIDFPPVPKATSLAQAQATRPPLGMPTSITSAENTNGSPASTSDGASPPVVDTSSSTTAAVVGGGALAVAAVFGFFAVRLARKR